MLTTIDGVAKGSARSVPGFNIYEALQNCDDLLLQFGGHEAAAGLAVELEKLEEFKKNTANPKDLEQVMGRMQTYLLDWLIQHILEQDMRYKVAFKKAGLS